STRDIAFIDTSAITTLAYAHYYFDRASTALEKIVEKNRWKYRHVLLCGDEIPFEDTPDRSGPESRGRLQKINEQLLDKYKIPYTRVFGSREDRGILIQNYILKGDIWNGY
ncbi:MAG TPA: AAA family ATPase, partial [Treponemataceae bacterium]|nr:AAA family ATPase [Treponemataceae bacterium]